MPNFGSLSSFTFTSLRGATDSTWDQSEAADFTSSGTDALMIYTQIIAGSTAAASAGHYVDWYFSQGPDTTRMSGGWAGGDDSYDPAVSITAQEATFTKSLRYLGRTPYGDSGSSALEYNQTFTVTGPIPRYGALVTFNQGVTLSTDTDVQASYQTVDYSS